MREQKKKISVIIPIYNTKDYIYRCLDSVRRQTYKNLEVLCIDDGSTDGSQEIADEIAREDSRFLVMHKENGGESSARNIGLQLATGEYIAFLDCDDWIEEDMYQRMYELAEKEALDLVVCGYSMDTDHECRIMKNAYPVSEERFGRKELFAYVYERDKYRGVTSWIWCKLYKREILKNQIGDPLFFDESLKLGGDIYFFIQAAANVETAGYINNSYYHYYQRESSTVHSRRLDIWMDILTAYDWMIKFLEQTNIETSSIPWLKRFLGYRAMLIAKMSIEQEQREITKKCRRIMRLNQDEYRMLNQDHPERIAEYESVMMEEIRSVEEENEVEKPRT